MTFISALLISVHAFAAQGACGSKDAAYQALCATHQVEDQCRALSACAWSDKGSKSCGSKSRTTVGYCSGQTDKDACNALSVCAWVD